MPEIAHKMSPQQCIAHYKILSKLGEGGMGAVYRATDTKLNREVAIKVLPDSFAADPDRLARFTREAQVLASLNHPNIAAIYGVEERAIVMELVEGQSPAGPLPVEEALPIIHQLIDALEYAHEKGIVHRDLKPANMKLTPDGRLKALDFGLAKALAPESEGGARNSVNSPTLTMGATTAGAIMGTAAYMAPEQARGLAVDKRADIWAFGAVVYALLTGRVLFERATISDTLAAVLKEEPDWEAIPPRIRRLLRLCLIRDPRQRLRDIGDARVLLGEAPEVPESLPPTSEPSRRGVPVWAATVLAMALLVAAGLLWRSLRPPDRPLIRLNVELGADALQGARTTAIISPDGTRLVYSVRGAEDTHRLATRLLDQAATTTLAGTEGAEDPFFSPDGQWIGFFADGHLKKMSVQGGPAVTLCDASDPRGAAWGPDGTIIFNPDLLHLFRVSDAGGKPQMVAKPEDHGERTFRWPQFLPGGREVLLSAGNALNSTGGYDNGNIEALSPQTGQLKIVQRGGYFGRYLPSGHLTYVHQGTLFGVAFDLARLEPRGTPIPLLTEVAGNAIQGSGQLDFANNGILLYLSGKPAAAAKLPIAWLDSSGKTQVLTTVQAPGTPRVSPDGERVALSMGEDIAVYDPRRGSLTRLTFNSAFNRSPVWTRDGRHIIYAAANATGNDFGIWWIPADGSGQPQLLHSFKRPIATDSLSPDGRHLAFGELTGGAISILPLDTSDPGHPKAGDPETFLNETGSRYGAAFSPDGRWLAYTSNEAGLPQVFVRPFPPRASGKWQISINGGSYPLWSDNGRELFFLTPQGRIMVAPYTAKGDLFLPERTLPWSDTPVQAMGARPYDLAPGGKRFLVIQPTSQAGNVPVHVTVLLNFFDELKRRIP